MARTSILLAVLLLFLAPSAHAVVIYKRGSQKPITGHLLRQNDKEVVIRDESSAGLKELVIPRNEIEDFLESVSVARLEALDPARPLEYREYAEELAEKKLDPEARLMAVRLFQIAAWLDLANDPHGDLLGLVSVALPGAEEARFRAAAYLFDPGHHRDLLEPPANGKPGSAPEELLAALQQIRRGHGDRARAALQSVPVAEELAAHQGFLGKGEFLAACSARELSDEQLRKILALELSLMSRLEGGRGEHSAITLASWDDSVRGGDLAPLPSLQFDKLTPFNPRESVYREGKWRLPEVSR